MNIPIRLRAFISVLFSILCFYGYLYKAFNNYSHADTGPSAFKEIHFNSSFDEIVASVQSGMNSFEMISNFALMLLVTYFLFFVLNLFNYSFVFIFISKKGFEGQIQKIKDQRFLKAFGLFEFWIFLVGVLFPGILFFIGYCIPLYQGFITHGVQIYSLYDLFGQSNQVFSGLLWLIMIVGNFILSTKGKFHLIANMAILKIYQTQDSEQKNEQQA